MVPAQGTLIQLCTPTSQHVGDWEVGENSRRGMARVPKLRLERWDLPEFGRLFVIPGPRGTKEGRKSQDVLPGRPARPR